MMPAPASGPWRYLPRANNRLLALTAAGLALFYAAVAVGFAANIMSKPVGLLLAPLFALLAWGMWKLARFARWVTVIWLWILVVLMPLAAFHSDAGQPVYWGTMLAAITPFVVLGVFCIYVLGKNKREFKWP
jgi:hypothetical protein